MEITIIESCLFSNFTKLFLCMLGIKIASKSFFWFFVSAADKNSARRLWVRDCVKIISLPAILLVSTRASPTSRVMKKLNLEKGNL